MDASDMRRSAKLAPVAVSNTLSRRIAFLSPSAYRAHNIKPCQIGIKGKFPVLRPNRSVHLDAVIFLRGLGNSETCIGNSAAVAQAALG